MTATMPQSTDLRDCHLYRFWVRDPLTGTRVLGYVGETVRLPFERLMEHVYSQPWADTILAWEVDEVSYLGKSAVLEAERAAIRAERPLYNVRENEWNPQRIPPPVAIRQRRARDLERNKPRWVHPGDRGAARLMPGAAESRVSTTRSWSALKVNLCLWSAVWAVTAVILWGSAGRTGVFPTTAATALFGCLASLVLCLWGLAGAPITRRQRRAWWARVKRKAGW